MTARKPIHEDGPLPAEPPAPPKRPPIIEATPPGPNVLEIRVNGKIACLQRVYDYAIDQQPGTITVTGALKPEAHADE